jgi:hypothetical protein
VKIGFELERRILPDGAFGLGSEKFSFCVAYSFCSEASAANVALGAMIQVRQNVNIAR